MRPRYRWRLRLAKQLWLRPNRASLFFDPLNATEDARAAYRGVGHLVLVVWPFVFFHNPTGVEP